MTFMRVVEANINGRRFQVPENSTAKDLIVAGGADPESCDLVQSFQDGSTEIHKPRNRVKSRDGGNFETILAGEGG
ncbi:hypothetical protein ACFL6B_03800 [Thermodesulfobacteriota bacterium]